MIIIYLLESFLHTSAVNFLASFAFSLMYSDAIDTVSMTVGLLTSVAMTTRAHAQHLWREF